MSDDGLELRMRTHVLPCWACARAAKKGALHLTGKGLLRAGTVHLIGGPGNRPLCERKARHR